MPITVDDLKIFKSADQTQTESGGGIRSSDQVVTDVANNLWTDVSRADRVAGATSINKVFAVVDEAGSDILLGGHTAIGDFPTDASVKTMVSRISDDIPSHLINKYFPMSIT